MYEILLILKLILFDNYDGIIDCLIGCCLINYWCVVIVVYNFVVVLFSFFMKLRIVVYGIFY